MSETLSFPPLMTGEAAMGGAFEHAAMRAASGCEAGLIAHRLEGSTLEAALVLAPEVPLRDAMAMLPLCGIGFQNAFGALAPPEVAVHLEWDGGLRINGARCGGFRCMADTSDPDAQPNWLVVGFTLPLYPPQDPDLAETGLRPDETAIYAEGCADIQPPALLEAWARHSLHWINRWEGEGNAPLHAEWRGLAHGIGDDITMAGKTGQFLGVDEHFAMLLRDAQTTHLIPLTTILEPSP
ncbi:MAG: DUF4444 domain-containing protein [Sulfitobacter sp.]